MRKRFALDTASYAPATVAGLYSSLGSFPGLQSPNAVEGLVKFIRRMTSGRHWIDVGDRRWVDVGGVALPVNGSAINVCRTPRKTGLMADGTLSC